MGRVDISGAGDRVEYFYRFAQIQVYKKMGNFLESVIFPELKKKIQSGVLNMIENYESPLDHEIVIKMESNVNVVCFFVRKEDTDGKSVRRV